MPVINMLDTLTKKRVAPNNINATIKNPTLMNYKTTLVNYS